MTTHRQSHVIRAPREQVFDLVADVERYPQFLPLWLDARIEDRQDNAYRTIQEVGLGPIRERFRTTTVLDRPRHIEVNSDDSLFREFAIVWDFGKAANGCTITIALTWTVRSWVLQQAIDLVLPQTVRSMASAFEYRALERLGRGRTRSRRSPP